MTAPRPEPSTLTTADILSLSGKLLGLIFLLAIIYDVFKKGFLRYRSKSSSNSSANSVSSEQISLCVRVSVGMEQVLLLSQMAIEIYTIHYTEDEEQCHFMIRINCFLLHLTGALLYIIFVRRIEIMYRDSFFAFSWLHIHSIYLLIAIYSLPYLCWIDWFSIESEMDDHFGCTLRTDPWSLHSGALALNLGVQTVIAAYTLFLFIRPLQILANEQDILNHKVSYHLTMVCIKYSILYSVIMASSITLSVLYLCTRYGYHYSIFHSFINGTVLILVNAIHNHWYKRICCACHCLCILCCGKNARKQHDDDINPRSSALEGRGTNSTMTSPRARVSKPENRTAAELVEPTTPRPSYHIDDFSDPETPEFPGNQLNASPDFGSHPEPDIDPITPMHSMIRQPVVMPSEEEILKELQELTMRQSMEMVPNLTIKTSSKLSLESIETHSAHSAHSGVFGLARSSGVLTMNKSKSKGKEKRNSTMVPMDGECDIREKKENGKNGQRDSAMDIFGKEINRELKRKNKRKSPRAHRAGTVGAVRFAPDLNHHHCFDGPYTRSHGHGLSLSPRKGKHPHHVSDECGMVVNVEALYTFRQRESIRPSDYTTKIFSHRSEPMHPPIQKHKETRITPASLKAASIALGMRQRGKTSWGDLDDSAHKNFEKTVRNTLRLVKQEACELEMTIPF